MNLPRGLIFSLIGHSLVLYLALYGTRFANDEFIPPQIYSITIEGGKDLGGMTQVPKEEKKEPVAPPKKVQYTLIISVGVTGGHRSVSDTKIFQNNFGHRR